MNPTDRVLKIYKLSIKESKMAGRDFVAINDLISACYLESSGIASHILKLHDFNIKEIRQIPVDDCQSLISINSLICNDCFTKSISVNNEVIFDSNDPIIYAGEKFVSAVNKACEISKSNGNTYFGTEHILLGICATSKIVPDFTEDVNLLLKIPSRFDSTFSNLNQLSRDERVKLFDKFCSCGNLKPCNCKE